LKLLKLLGEVADRFLEDFSRIQCLKIENELTGLNSADIK